MINLVNCLLKKKKIKDFNVKRKVVIKKIEKIKKGFVILEINIYLNKIIYDSKRVEFEKKKL